MDEILFSNTDYTRDFENLKSLETYLSIVNNNISQKIRMFNSLKSDVKNFKSYESFSDEFSLESEKVSFKEKVKIFFTKIFEFFKKIGEKIVHFLKVVYYKFLLFLKKLGQIEMTSVHYLPEEKFKYKLNLLLKDRNALLFKLKCNPNVFKNEVKNVYRQSYEYMRSDIKTCMDTIIRSVKENTNSRLATTTDITTALDNSRKKYENLLLSSKKLQKLGETMEFKLTSQTTSKEFYKVFDQVYLVDNYEHLEYYEEEIKNFQFLLNELSEKMLKFSKDLTVAKTNSMDTDEKQTEADFKFCQTVFNFGKTINDNITLISKQFYELSSTYRLAYQLFEIRN